MTTPNTPTGQLKSHSVGQTLVLTFSNPGFRNALSPQMYAAAVEALNVAADSSAIRSVVFTGEDGHFCAGGNLNRLLENRAQPPEVQAASIEQLHDWIDTLRSFPKPIVAAVEGAAAGAGFSIALACDLIVAANNAVFAMSYSRVGLSPDGGGSWHLAQALPRQLAAELMMGAQKCEAPRLHSLGVVNRLTEPGQALADALAWCAQLNGQAPNALESIKDLLNAAPTQGLLEHMAQEKTHFVNNLHHANGKEGIESFLQKRPADYK